MNLFCNDIVMVSIVFFACNVQGKVPMGGQRGSSVSRQYKNDGILKTVVLPSPITKKIQLTLVLPSPITN